MDFNNLSKKQKRIVKVFIESAVKIMLSDGLQAVTIRRVADEVGFSTATLYGYFDNITELVNFAVTYCISDYLNELGQINSSDDHPVKKLVDSWSIYSYYVFQHPSIYEYAFFSESSQEVVGIFNEFKNIYPGMLKDYYVINDYRTTYERCVDIVNKCVEIEYFHKEDADDINYFLAVIHHGVLYELLYHGEGYSASNMKGDIVRMRSVMITYLESMRVWNGRNPSVRELVGEYWRK